MIADLVGFLCYPLSNIDSRLLPGWGDIPRRIRAVSNWSLSIAFCLILIACTVQPAAAPTAVATVESPTPTRTVRPAAAPTAVATVESPTPTRTVQPSATPVGTLSSSSATPTPASRVAIITSQFRETIDTATQDSSCYVDRTFEGTISNWSTRSIIHLRAYTGCPAWLNPKSRPLLTIWNINEAFMHAYVSRSRGTRYPLRN